MKNLKFLFLAFFLILITFRPSPTKAYTGTPDQFCANPPTPDQFLAVQNNQAEQTFISSYNRIPEIGLYFFETGGELGKTVTVGIINSLGQLTAQKSIEITTSRWYEIVFDSPAQVTTDSPSRIFVTADETSLGYWGANEDPSCYSNGAGLSPYGGEPFDFYFLTFGYNEGLPEPPPETTPTPTTTPTGTTPTPSASASQTTTITTPSDLKGVYNKDLKIVQLSWQMTESADIDGYRIFRSKFKDRDFKKIGETKKEQKEYLDKEITDSETYFYYVKAYNNQQESANSNTAEVSVKKTSASSSPTTTQTDSKPSLSKTTWLIIILIITLVLLTTGFLAYKLGWFKKVKNFIKKKKQS